MALEFLDESAQTFFELSSVLRTSHDRCHVECDNAASLQQTGHFVGADSLGEPLHDGAFSHTGFTDEDGVVLFASA